MNNLRHIKEIPRNRFRGVDGKGCTSLEAVQVFYAWKHSDVVGYNRVEIEVGKREVHNFELVGSKVWTLRLLRKDAYFIKKS